MGLLSELRPVEAILSRSHTLLEGPRITADGALLYSDVLAGGVYRHEPSGEIHTVVPDRRGVGGLVAHERGGVVLSGRDLVHVEADGSSRQLLSREGVTGFNDLSTTATGAIVVGGLRYRPLAGEAAVPGEILIVSRPGSAELLSDGVLWPNGIAVGPAEGRLYVSDYAREQVLVIEPGRAETVFADAPRGSADGLALDVEGGLWLALGQGGGVARFHVDGRLDEIVDVPAGFVSSISFGGEDGCDVVIATADNVVSPDTGGTLFLARSEVAGLRVASASV